MKKLITVLCKLYKRKITDFRWSNFVIIWALEFLWTIFIFVAKSLRCSSTSQLRSYSLCHVMHAIWLLRAHYFMHISIGFD